MKALNVLLSVVVSLVLGVLVLEGGLRLLGLGPPKSLNVPDARVGWVKKSGATVTRRTTEGFDVTYELNRFGLRDDADMPERAPQGTFRVLCLGDSFTLGYTVERSDLFVDLLEDWWSDEGRRVDVVNAGTEGYSTDQEVAWLLEHGEALAPDLVLLFPYENDLYWNGQPAYYGAPKPLFRPDGTLETGDLPVSRRKPLSESTALGRLIAGGPRPDVFTPEGHDRAILKEWAPLLDPAPAFMADALARTRGALTALRAKCEELGAPVVVAPIPSHSAIDPAFGNERFGPLVLGGLPADRWSADKPVELVLEAARAAGLRSVDARAFLRQRFAEEADDLYFDVDWHLNPAGNRAFATFLHGELDRLSLVPPAEHGASLAAAVSAPPGEGSLPRWLPWFLGLWVVLGVSYAALYRDERAPLAFLKVGGLLGTVFLIAVGGSHLLTLLPPVFSRLLLVVVLVGILGFVAYKLGRRLATIGELVKAFVARGHWYLMPLVVILLTVGSLLVVAASSPLVAPFIYTLF